MVTAYLRQRFPLQLYVPLAAIVAFAASPRLGSWWTTAMDASFGLLLLLQFRTWDDLADRTRDARLHPDRVLVRSPQVTPVIGFCGALAVLNLCVAVWRDGSGVAVALLAALNALFGTWYLCRDGGSDDPATVPLRTAAGDYLVLAKYPVILLIVAGDRIPHAPVRIALLAGALYAGACAYEAWHDPESPLARRHPSLAARGPVGDR